MTIFLDANILFNNWYLENANFRLLFNYAENTNSKILISEIVCKEVNNKFYIEYENCISNLKSSQEKLEILRKQKIEINYPKNKTKYDIKKIIKSKSDSVIIYPFNNISNSVLVKRAISRVKPFHEKDKGFRDTLIWLSFLASIKKYGLEGDVIFISNNYRDFYQDKLTELHSDLVSDLSQMKIDDKFKPFQDLHSFITSFIDKSVHEIRATDVLEKMIYENEDLIEIEVKNALSKISNLQLTKLFGAFRQLINIFHSFYSFHFDIIEGIEDPSLLNYRLIDDSLVYIEMLAILRLVEFTFVVPSPIFTEIYETIQNSIHDFVKSSETTTFYIYDQVRFNASFIYNRNDNSIRELVINELLILK